MTKNRAWRFFKILILVLFLLLGLAIVLTQVPQVQLKAAKKGIEWLSVKSDSEVSLQGFKWTNFQELELTGFYMEDRQGDTLIAVQQMNLHFSPKALFTNRFIICDLKLQDGLINLSQNSDSIWNYQFVLDAFASDAIVDTTTTVWSFDPRTISLEKFRFNYSDRSAQLNVSLPALHLDFNLLDLQNQLVEINLLEMTQPDISFVQMSDKEKDLDASSPVNSLTMPDLGWDISLTKTKMSDAHIAFRSTPFTVVSPDHFNPANVNVSALGWEIDNLLIKSDELSANINSFGFKEHSGLILDDLRAQVVFSDSKTSLSNFDLKTAQSTIQFTATANYPTLQELFDFIQDENKSNPSDFTIDVADLDASISPVEIDRLFPGIISSQNNEQIKMSATAQGDFSAIDLSSFELSQGKHMILNLSGNVDHPLDINKLNADVDISNLQTNYATLTSFLPKNTLPQGLASWQAISAKGKISASRKNINATQLHIITTNGPQFSGNISVKGVNDIETALIALNIKNLNTNTSHWTEFIKDTLPPIADSLGDIALSGTFTGTTTKFHSNLSMDSDLGALHVDANFDFAPDYSYASYSGKLQLNQFHAGTVIGDTALRQLTMDAEFSGVGLAPKDWDTDIDMAIKNIVYKAYSYDSLVVIGKLRASIFTGDMAMNDKHLKFNFSGKIPITDSISSMDITLHLDTVDLMPLGFSQSPLSLSLNLKGEVIDFNVDDLKTNMFFSTIVVSDSANTLQLDSMKLVSSVDETGIRNLSFDSDFLQMGLTGEYQLSTLPKEIEDWLAQDFPIQQILHPIETGDIAIDPTPETNEFPSPPTNIIGFIHLSDPTFITSTFLPDLKQLDTARLRLEFDKSKKLWELDVSIPTLKYADWSIDSLEFNSNYRELFVKSDLKAKHIQFGDNTNIENGSINILLKEDKLIFDAISAVSADSISWQIGGNLSTDGRAINLSFDPALRINGSEYSLQSNNIIYSDKNQWTVGDLAISRNGSKVSIRGGQSKNEPSSLSIDFETFDIDILSPVLDFPTGYMAGELNGTIQANDLQNNLNYTTDLILDDWTIDSMLMGKLGIQASQKLNEPLIYITGELTSPSNDIAISGNYDISSRLFDIEANLRSLSMATLDPFLIGMIHDSEGNLTGQFTLTGSPDKPIIDGKLTLNNGLTTVDYVNIPYRVDDATISINEKSIELGTISMMHGEQDKAILSGSISHEYFDNFNLDINFNTDKFQFLNTSAKDNELFYGTVLLKTDMHITGPIERISYRIDATTLPGTELYVIPLTEEQVVAQENYIIFGRPQFDSLGRDTNVLNETSITAPAIDLQLNLEMTPEAVFQIIIDPLTGDKLICTGTSNLSVVMTPDGNVEVVGNYEIKEGKYFFSYEQLVKKEFDILENSKISFDGDPLKARLDITAAYQTRVPLSDLVSNQLGGVQNTLTALRSDVRVLMKIGGNLENPILTFDIELVGSPQGTMADAARTRLQQLRTNETDLNTQVFGLLLFNSFIADDRGGQSIAGAGEAIVLSSLSKLVSNQLNKLAAGVLKGVELNLGVESYKAGVESGSAVTTEVQLGLSKRLLDDRLNVKVGGNLNVGATDAEQETLTALTGDFALEYQLKENGNSILRVYQRSDYDALYEGNVNKTGVGISIRKDLKNKELKQK